MSPFLNLLFETDSYSNAYLLAKFGFDTADNEPFHVCPLSSYRSPRFTDDSAQDKAVKSMDLENKGKDKTTAESDLVTTKSDLEATQKELDAALAYYEKLKPSCVDAGLSYEERVKMREEEIQSLQEALRILSGEDI